MKLLLTTGMDANRSLYNTANTPAGGIEKRGSNRK